MTAISVIQCVDKGFLHLDDDISTILSQWQQPSILLGFDDATGAPILQEAKEKITLRMLLTHQNGMGYAFIRPDLKKYLEYKDTQETASELIVGDGQSLKSLTENSGRGRLIFS